MPRKCARGADASCIHEQLTAKAVSHKAGSRSLRRQPVPVRNALDVGETLMERWLTARGYAYQFEPDWGVRTCPDVRVDVRGQVVAIEVETIHSRGLLTDQPIGTTLSRGMDKALRPLRHQIEGAAKQLKPLAPHEAGLAGLVTRNGLIGTALV